MEFYVSALVLGLLGLAGMAIAGGGRHGGARGHGGGHGHVGHGGHAAHLPAHTGHAAGHAAGHAGGHAVAHGAGTAAHAHAAHPSISGAASRSVLSLVSPRILFSFSLGLGATGLIARGVLGGPFLFAAAVAGGIFFERLIVTPIWNFGFRFESQPALTLESAVDSEATVVSNFDANGQGLIAVELDGQLVQLLGTLAPAERAAGVRVTAGMRVRIQEVDAARNRCTVSRM